MFLPIYVLTLGISSGVLGAFARRFIAAQGLLPDFTAGIAVTCTVAAVYAAAQLLFMGMLRLLKPTHSSGPLLTESLSHACALVLVPFLLGIPVPLPHSALYKVEPLVYLGLFAAGHLVFKLVTIFSVTQSAPAGRLGAFAWLGCSLLALLGAQQSFDQWRNAFGEARLVPLQQEIPVRVADIHTFARPALEGAMYTFEIPPGKPRNLLLKWANPPENAQPLTSIGVKFWIDDVPVELPEPVLKLKEGWTGLRLSAALFAEGAKVCRVSWSADGEADWMQEMGLRLLSSEADSLLLSGPHFHEPSEHAEKPGLVVLLVDGLGAEHVGQFGYARDTVPSLAAFSRGALAFSHAFTPAPETAAACMSLLTGVNPLVHEYLGVQRGPLAPGMQTLPELLHARGYATAAFTEADANEGDLAFGADFDRGIEHFDVGYAKAGSAATLERAAAWLAAHQEDSFMLLVRLSELSQTGPVERYGSTFTSENMSTRPLDVHDNALAYLDKKIGEFLAGLDNLAGPDGPCVIITSPYGLDFSRGWSAKGEAALTEPSLRVPLFIRASGIDAGRSATLVQLEDVPVGVAGLLGVAFPHSTTGANLLEVTPGREAISLTAEPLILSLRNEAWRFTWNSGMFPFTLRENAEQGVVQYLNMTYYEKNWRQPDNLVRESSLAVRYRDKLWQFARLHLAREEAAPKVTPTVEAAEPAP